MSNEEREKIIALHKKYARDEEQFELIYTHCEIVRDIALWCAGKTVERVDIELLEKASLLHDIGSYGYFHDSFDRKYYMQHALVGAELLLGEGYSAEISDIVRTHILLGVTPKEVITHGWKIPAVTYEPTSVEAEILGYADRFHTKDPVFNSYEMYSALLKSELPEQSVKFEKLVEKYGITDLMVLSEKYKQPIR